MTSNEIKKALECCADAEDILVKGHTYKAEPLCTLFKETIDLLYRYETEIEGHRTEVEELRFRLEQNSDERSKIGMMFEETLKENEDLKKKVEFLSGQCEAYKYCISKKGGAE